MVMNDSDYLMITAFYREEPALGQQSAPVSFPRVRDNSIG